MLRPLLTLVAASLAVPALAQSPGGSGAIQSTDCQLSVNPTPASWIITGFDPFAESLPQGTFGVTFVNEGGAECRFTPTVELSDPPFGLTKGTSQPVGYALLNITDTQDVTPRTGRSRSLHSQSEVVLKPKDSRSMLYKLVAQPGDVRAPGTYTQNVTLEAQDREFRSLGGARLVLGITVLPSARIGLAGTYKMSGGQAVVNLGELRKGKAPILLNLLVSSTGEYDISVTSANDGQLRLGSSQWFVPYSVAIGNNAFNLRGPRTMAGATKSPVIGNSLPFEFTIGDVSHRRAGVYSDVLSISITAR